MTSVDYPTRILRFDWRTKWRLGFYHYGAWRFLRIGKLGVQLWRIS